MQVIVLTMYLYDFSNEIYPLETLFFENKWDLDLNNKHANHKHCHKSPPLELNKNVQV